MRRTIVALTLVAGLSNGPAAGWELSAWPEFYRPGPFGKTLAVDGQPDAAPAPLKPEPDGRIRIRAARGGYASFHLAVADATGGPFTLRTRCEAPGIRIELFREWFHRNRADGLYYGDALIPVPAGAELRLPDAEMKVPKQTQAAFWVDVYVAPGARVGPAEADVELTAGEKTIRLPLTIDVAAARIPAADALTADHNTYGFSLVNRHFPQRRRAVEAAGRKFFDSDEFWKSVHDMYRMHYEHRGTLHIQGGNHVGAARPGYVPETAGRGRQRRVTSWRTFDRHYGPLLDGSAFAGCRRGGRPIPSMYLHITMEWPADYVNIFRPGFEVEFVNVVSEMERHFREKGWTRTDFELFLRHKKRYRGFCWDGDETRFKKDNDYFRYFDRLLKKAVPAGTPVRFVHRADASWLMGSQFRELEGVINFWSCGGGILAMYRDEVRAVRRRGEPVWFYCGTPSAFGPTVGVLAEPVKAWMMDLDGFERWNTARPPPDPWFAFDGGGSCLIYPGHRFGVDGVLPSVRLKLQRNILQTVALLRQAEGKLGGQALRKHAAGMAGASPDDWWCPDAEIRKMPVLEWSNATLGRLRPAYRRNRRLNAAWWLRVAEYALKNLEAKP